MNILDFDNVSFSFGKESIIRNVSFAIEKGDYCGVVGPNGGGKTTILRLIIGLLKPDSGKITINGKSIKESRNIIGYVPQYSNMDNSFPISVEQVVAMGVLKRFNLSPFLKSDDKRRVEEALDLLKIRNLRDNSFGDLSGGQKQRVLIARAIVSNPEILILDEPTASVDSEIEKEIYILLKEFNKDKTIILVSHDMEKISSASNRLLCVNRKVIVHSTENKEFHDSTTSIYNPELKIIKHKCGI